MALVVAAGVACIGGCKKKEAPPPPPAAQPAPAAKAVPPEPPLPTIHCPSPDTFFAPFLADPPPSEPAPGDKKSAAKAETKTKLAKASKPGGKNAAKTLRVDCTVFAPGRFWLATALSYDEKTGKNPRLGLFSGSPSSRMMLFEIAPLPTEAIEKLIADNKEISVKIRKTRDDSSLVRLGVVGGPGGGKPDSSEVGMLLQLVAHQPPRILWVGPGDQVASADGCVVEQTVDFELLFRTRLERFTTSKPRAGADGKIPATCKSDPGTQESLSFQPVALGRGRAVGEPPAATP